MISYDRLCEALRVYRDRKLGKISSEAESQSGTAPIGDTSEIDVHSSDIVEE